MVGIGRTSNAFFFDGVTDSILIPQGNFTSVGPARDILGKTSRGGDEFTHINSIMDDSFVIEAWVVPDCGGIVAHRDEQFTLEFGTVDTPGPAKFTVQLKTQSGMHPVSLSTAKATSTRWDGVVYPPQEVGGIHDTYNRYLKDNTAYNDATNLNFKHRGLYHVVAGVTAGSVFLYVNGHVVATQEIDIESRIADSTAHVYIGGKGGEFRGAIEAIHFNSEFDSQMAVSTVPVNSDTTKGMYRFEEPLDIVEESYDFNAFTVAADGTTTTITVAATDAQALIARLTGKPYDSTSATTTFTATPYSMGNYKVTDFATTPGTEATLAIPHTPYNILINPGSINRNTEKPNASPPERARIESINGSTGVITVSSIHIDFNISGGKRGLLHSRTADIDNYFVVVNADLLIDNGTGKPYQPPHYGSQIFDKTGQMVIDESNFSQHALVYSTQMATTDNSPSNPFAVSWPSTLDVLYQVGHSGRHRYSHITGHEYMRRYPQPAYLSIDQIMGGTADVVEMGYDSNTKGIADLFAMNALSDFYEESTQVTVANFINSTPATFVVSNGLAKSKEQAIAIGGTNFDYRPFMLKGPVPEFEGDINDDTRLYHLRPESVSRIALLKVPTLQTTHSLAPYVEIHYNAVDLTGASMGKTTPCLMIEKTVPSGNYVLTGSTTVLDVIEADLADATKDTTLFAPGGLIMTGNSQTTTTHHLETEHSLIGDNTGGYELDSEVDFSRCPVNYTPPGNATTDGNTTPQHLTASHNNGVHDSAYHKLCIEPNADNSVKNMTEIGLQSIKPAAVINTGTGVFDEGSTTDASNNFEMFDIIDNVVYNTHEYSGIIFVQPSDRTRTNQLSKMRTNQTEGNSPSIASLLYLMSRTRIRSIKEDEDPGTNEKTVTVLATGIAEGLANQNVNITGSGSPDSHIVKEIEPNAPVVTVTLGGPGQGAINTKPTYDPSPLMRLPGSTRRSCAVQAVSVNTDTDRIYMSVQPLNNLSTDMASWGTYCFPKVGRVYLEDGASAAYSEKTGSGFVFTVDTSGGASIEELRSFLDANGTAYTSFHEWLNGVGIITNATEDEYEISVKLFNDPHFGDDNLCEDGSTVNDRMFQSMDTVNHDYQLGTQYASTRAMVEVPLFPKQFFDHAPTGIFPGPDNSMKIHLDATYTAHSWNPTPVGRRADDIAVSDRNAHSAYGFNANSNEHVSSTTITQIVVSTNHTDIYVSHPKLFPSAESAENQHRNMKDVIRYRRVFLSNNQWGIYQNDPATDGYIRIPTNVSGGFTGGFSEDFFADAIVGALLYVAGGYRNETLIPIASDESTPSSDLENRSPYYYDPANMQTQGGNLDYGLRQYVSAVEFKEGPLTNPHAPRIQSKNASSTILEVNKVSAGLDNNQSLYYFTVDDASTFPEVPFSKIGGYETDSNNPTFGNGDMIFVAEVLTDTPIEMIFLGNIASVSETANQFVCAAPSSFSTTNFKGKTIRLKKACRALYSLTDPANAYINEFSATTFKPSVGGEQWTFTAAGAVGATTLSIAPATATLMPQANTVGINLRPGDELFIEDVSDANHIKYVGKVAFIESPYAGSGHATNTVITLDGTNATTIASGDPLRVSFGTVTENDPDAILNRTWLYPYAQGGLRNGDTIWMNMTMNNPHAVEGLFAKSRGVLSEGQVWTGFNGGKGALATRPRDSIPLENFLIGDSCLETANNFVQHVNKTIELNYESMGLSSSQAPTVAYLDPYLATKGHARVLMFDVAHDREFIAFHDLHMQVQSSAATPHIGFGRHIVTADGIVDIDRYLVQQNGGAPHYFTTQIDVANGFPSENPYMRRTQQSKFIESAYVHNIAGNTSEDVMGTNAGGENPISNFLNHDSYAIPGQGKTKLALIGNSFTEACDTDHAATGTDTHVFGGNVRIIRLNGTIGIRLSKFSVGMTVSGTGIASGSKIIEIDINAGLLYLDKDTTATNSNQTLTFTTTNNSYFMGKGHGHYVHTGFMNEGTSSSFTVADSTLPRVQPAVASPYWADRLHALSRKSLGATQTLAGALKKSRLANNPDTFTLRDASTMMDTPDGTRAISAFLCLKGIRSQSLLLSNHEESRLQHLDHWSKMDFVRRLTIDFGKVGIKEGVTDIEAAAREIVRLINQGGAKNALTTGAMNADTGSIHDPAPWWFADEAFDTQDRGSHMGYLRAHLGRVVEDLDGNTGHSIVIHSTIPGASGRNFCTWLDNSKGQSQYKPQFLIGHGGRFRNFWCQPDETSGENMHPAPMPINKHGRPFAPITTLREYVTQEETDDNFVSNGDFDVRQNDLSSTIQGRNTKRSISAFNGSGMNANTINDESFESQSPSKTLVEGLRTGTQAVGRINFGGMVAAGIPGFAPDAGVWGLGERGNTDFDTRYSNAISTGNTAPTSIADYSDHVTDSQVENVGDGQLYGFQFEDHRGNNYGVRYIYRDMGTNFSNDNTILPPTLDNEICVYFDDRDVGQGGFTIGNHMLGFGDVTGRIDTTGDLTEASYRGNRWNGVPAPSVGIDASVTWSGTELTVVLQAPFDTGGVGDGVMGNHPDVLGYLGFPKTNGLLQINDTFTGTTGYTDADGNAGIKGIVGHTVSYTHRTQNDNNGTHIFYGVVGDTFTSSHFVNSGTVDDTTKVNPTDNVQLRVLLSPRINWTTLVTDELMAAVTAAAINHEDPNRLLNFDCREMYAADGRTFGQWGVAPDAIKIRAHTPSRNTLPLSQMFEATLHKDWGIQAAHLEYGEYTTLHETTVGWTLVATDPINKPYSDAELDSHRRMDVGYLPYTVLQLRSKGRGFNANTATPVLVDSSNTPLSVTSWRRNLKGENYTSITGDHILPCLNNPILLFNNYDSTGGNIENEFVSKTNKIAHAIIPAGQEADSIDSLAKEGSFGEELVFSYATADGIARGAVKSIKSTVSHTSLTYTDGHGNGLWRTAFNGDVNDDFVLTRFAEPNQPGIEREAICGYRSYGSVDSEPIIFFRGARDSIDHSVPLYFGGGFTGVTLDINDGTQNDYSPFYTHPYSGGPTGTAGIQNANEISGSFAMVDCNALLAFFPGTALLNQHRGSINSPVSNKDSILSPDLRGGNLDADFALLNAAAAGDVRARYAAGIVRQQPVPLVLRFAHPTARYHDSQPIVDATCDINSNTTVNMDSTAQLVVGMTVTGAGIPDGATVASITDATTFVLSAAATASTDPVTLTFNYIENKTTYLVYGPGQAFPFTEDDNSNAAVEPHPGYVVTTGNTWSKVPHSKFLPNEITNSDNLYGPPDSTYQTARQRYHWRTTLNWSPPQGIPNVGYLQQRPEHGSHYGEVFTNPTAGKLTSDNAADYYKAHPYKHSAVAYYGIAMSADMTFHMDGGYHPGGSWLDNQMSFNAPNPNSNYRYALESWNQVNATAFRVSGVMAKTILEGANSETALNFDSDYIVVDGTRCQNGEELATIIGQAINENPGKGALKAMGGTFLPSMGNAMRQDRYGWIETNFVSYNNLADDLLGKVFSGEAFDDTTGDVDNSEVHIVATITGATQAELEQIPACGWIRTDTGGRDYTETDVAEADRYIKSSFGCYHSREIWNDSGTYKIKFYLAPNRISGLPLLEDITTWHNKCQSATMTFPTPGYDPGGGGLVHPSPSNIYVWSKAGVHRFNNENESSRNHMTQVHFGGLVDAIDRTRPVGAVGWAGERYSYLNSLKVGTEGYGAGKGAWHPKMGFTPYGSSASCMSVLGHLPSSYPMYNSPEASPRVNGQEASNVSYDVALTTPYTWNIGLVGGDTWYDNYDFTDVESTKDIMSAKPPHILEATDSNTSYILDKKLHHQQGVFSRAMLVISNESELALVAKTDRDGITATGDWLSVVSKTRAGVAAATAITFAGTTRWDERFHNAERYIAPANAGPNVEALIATGTATPTADVPNAAYVLHTALTGDQDANLYNAEPCFAVTGDLFFDTDISPGTMLLEDVTNVTRNITKELELSSTDAEIDNYDYTNDDYWLGDTNGYKLSQRTPAQNFSIEHVVWKRMDGGNLSLPAPNARGLGAVPFVTRVAGGNAYTTGEKLYGNNRFTFESTNSAMFPIIQAQELSHPQMASRHPDLLRNILEIPNEEIQFESITVVDDTGQEHTVEGGSPFGTIIRAFTQLSNRSAQGLAPAISGSGVEPNMKIRLPDPDSIPGNLIVRSGFDRLQAYQTETMGTGGMMTKSTVEHMFDNSLVSPNLGPTYSDHNWEHLKQGSDNPESTMSGWQSSTGNAPLETAYELHDRTLFFHVTKMGNTNTHKHPVIYSHADGVVNHELTGVSFSGTTLTVNTSVNSAVYDSTFGNKERVGERRFLRLYNPTTDEGGVASFTGISGSTFTGCVGDEAFNKLVLSSITTLKVVPSYYIPAGSTRFYGSRRIRDHAEVSGNSPDMAHTHYVNYSVTAEEAMTGYSIYKKPQLTPAPIPRMGHHFVNATMAMLPGHWAHPAYQGLYDKHRACRAATLQSDEFTILDERFDMDDLVTLGSASVHRFPTYDPLLVFGSLTATPSGPSDIHGGGFSLMFETKLRNDGYGVLASEGDAGVTNSKGGHTVVLEAAGNYTLKEHFPDPAEVGAYQIIIQPNMHSSQFIGYHANGPANDVPNGSVSELTSQQVALVVGIREPDSRYGAYALVLANATMADVRGCEIFVNELMIDHDPDHGSHFTNIPPLMLYNPLGVQATESPAFVRRSLPYYPSMFVDATPGFTTNIPWWSIVHKVGPDNADADRFNHLSWHRLDNYYEFLRASSGSIASQITLAGYPSFYPDLYSEILENISLTPVCSVVSVASTIITVDDARGFPKQPYYGMVLEYTDATGTRRTHTYTERSGYDSSLMNKPKQFTIVANSTFTNNLTVGTKLRLSRAYDFRPANTILSDSKTSIINQTLSQTLAGSRDTNSLHMADAFLCLWHPNLGRPHTFYSDASRTWLNPLTDRAINQKPLNSMPEHFETVHYHDATYYASIGPFALRMKTAMPPTEAQSTYYTATSASVSGTTVTATGAIMAGWPTSGTNTVYVNSGSEEEIFTYTGGGAGGTTLTGCVNVKGTPLTTMASGNHSLRYYKTADLAADGSHTRQVVSHTGNTITTNGGEVIADEAYIFVDGRMYQVNGTVAEGGTSVVVFDTLPPQIAVGSIIYTDADGTPQTAQTIDTTIGTGLMQGGQSDSTDTATKSMLNHFWPSGSRGGPLVSRLDGYAYVSSTWDYPRDYGFDGPIWSDADDDGSYAVSSGISKSSYDGISNPTRPRPFGYRFGLRQPYNKPQWSMYGLRALRETAVTATNASVGYTHGPLVQTETQTSTYAGGDGSSTSTFPNTYTGIMERQTNFSGMLGVDKPEWQVRYSDGVRFTRPFGCPIRTLRNSATVLRDWWGDGNGKGLDSIEDAAKYYIVDWWGNTRGEDVRRFPVRSFGIRPSWDAGDAYEYDRRNNRTPYQRIHNNGNHLVNLKGLTNAADTALSVSATLPRFGGRLNNTNNNDTNTLVDVFMPSNAQRVGDMGNGRGIRYPTQFNEDILTALSEPIHTTGLVLSHHTAEPILNDGFIRARNDVLQNTEVPRGISSRLEIAEDGLLKPEAVVSDRIENIVGDSPHKDAVSRSSPRIGLDTENLQGVDTNQIIINTEAHSLHTDRNVGQRVVLQGGMQTGSQTIGNYDLTALDFGGQPQGGAVRMSHTSNFNPLGGTYLAETRNFLSPVDDTDWGGIPTSGMVLWLKADSLDLADGAAVSSWKDSGPYGFEFTQSTASNQPSYIASSSNVNNMPVVDCDGDDKLETSFDARLNTAEMTVFVVAWADSDDGGIHGIIESRAGSPATRSGFNLYIRMDSNNRWQWWGGADTGWATVSSATNSAVGGQAELVTASITGGDGNGSTATLKMNLQGAGNYTTTSAFWKADTGGYIVGNVPSSFYLNGKIAEVIQYNRSMTTEEERQVEGYLAEKYGFSSNPSQWKSSNPYHTDTNGHVRTNVTDKKVTYMMRPVRMMDKQHIEMFRSNLNLHSSSPQVGSNYFGATAGGKYGLYVYDVDNGKASVGSYIRATNPDTNPPYTPAYYMDISASDTVPMSKGPKIIGTADSGFDSSKIDNEVTRVIISENTLEHYRSDASRRRTSVENDETIVRKDYSVQPRFSQALHPKGHKGDVSYNSTDHSGDGA